jgi:ketosteroid isomerase-like protein
VPPPARAGRRARDGRAGGDGKAVVTKFREVFSSGDVEGIINSMTDDATRWVAGNINNLYHFLFTLRDDKIASVKEYLDTEHTTAVFVAP